MPTGIRLQMMNAVNMCESIHLPKKTKFTNADKLDKFYRFVNNKMHDV